MPRPRNRLFYNRHRYYDPETGRYLSEDPIRLRGSLAFFAFCIDPTLQVDVDGLTCTRTGVRRNNPRDWRFWRDVGKSTGVDALSPSNLKRIAKKRVPVVDEQWLKWFPGDRLGEKISIHHVAGTRFNLPLRKTNHLDAHMPGGFKLNPGGPGKSGEKV
ncbi:MAG: RHS repeat-associated core domain-containing protein [Myxococcota bacterium]